MSKTMTIGQKKDLAELLYRAGTTVQKVLAGKVGVSEKTMSRWVNDGQWEKLRMNIPLVKQEQIQNLLAELQELDEWIRAKAEGRRFADSKEADIRRKLIADIKDLEVKANIAEIISVSISFTDFVAKVAPEKTKEIAAMLDAFVKDSTR